MNDSFVINDIEKLAYSIRKNAALTISQDSDEDLNSFITIRQVENLIMNYAVTMDDDCLVIDEEGYENIFEETSSWIMDAGLAKLAADNKIECAWDDEINEMVFWVANE